MMRTYKDYLLDIIAFVNDIEEFVYGMRFEDFIRDKKTINAVIRSLEIIGEAVKKIPQELREKYHEVDLEIVWRWLSVSRPPLKPTFQRIL